MMTDTCDRLVVMPSNVCVWICQVTVRLIVAWSITVLAEASNVPEYSFGPGQCPGLIQQHDSDILNCSTVCQRTTCDALQMLFKSTYNSSTPYLKTWRNRQGWEALLQQNCSQILAEATKKGTPAYCSWHGITCCRSLFRPYCNATNAVAAIQLDVNGLNGSVLDLSFQQSLAQLHACGLFSLQLAGNALSGSLDAFWGRLLNLRVLNIAKNMITGTLPESLRQMNKLMVLQLDRNPMHGTVPEWLSELQSLRALQLSAFAGRNADGKQGLVGTIPTSLGRLRDLQLLRLDSNSLTGAFPPQMCHPNIEGLVLRRNQLIWSMSDLQKCTNMTYLDISNNRFCGTLPDEESAWDFRDLRWLDLNSNGIEGTLPKAVFSSDTLTVFNMANNRLNGTIDSSISQVPYLVNLDLHGNQLTGTIDESVWYMPSLQSLDLSSNRLSGTISPAAALSDYLTTVRLNDNHLTGHVPPGVAILPSLGLMDLSNNRMSCQGAKSSNSTGSSNRCIDGQYLPCFLYSTGYTIPRTDDSHMECPEVERKARADIVRDCAGSGPTRVGDLVSSLPSTEIRVQDWHLDPSYYQYQGCKCLRGYSELWSNNRTVLSCVADQQFEQAPKLVRLAALLVSFFVPLLGALGLVLWYKLSIQLKKKWRREKELQSNRQKGVPDDGPAAIVVTDVEDYSELMRQNAALTIRALGVHNAILRKAVTTHAGHTIEQEGDSWSVAFHRSVDAVAFCLQVQQALQRSNWPDGLLQLTCTKPNPAESRPSVPVLAATQSSQPMAAISHEYDSTRSTQNTGIFAAFTNSTAAAAASSLHALDVAESSMQSGQQHSESLSMVPATLKMSFSSKVTGLMQLLAGRNSCDSTEEQHNSASDNRSPFETVMTSATSDPDGLCSEALHQQQHASFESATTGARGLTLTFPSRTLSSLTRAKHTGETYDTVMGLRVRMGIASGWIPAKSDIKTSAVFALAKAVSDMANGGQVLMESRTAAAVHDWLNDLSCVDHKGYNDKLLSSPLTYRIQDGTNSLTRCLLKYEKCRFRARVDDRDPVLLDLGQYWIPGLAATITAAAAADTAGDRFAVGGVPQRADTRDTELALQLASNEQPGGHQSDSVGLLWQMNIRACVAATASALLHGQPVAGVSADNSINVHSIVARPLHIRSLLWKNELNLIEDCQQLVKGYFDAPGTLQTSETSSGVLAVNHPVLPSVTVVFASVQDGKQLVRKSSSVAKLIHNVISRVMQAVLLSLPDGYMCHEIEAVLKYMVAFKEPARAAEWCLLVQEALRHVPWPHEALEAMSPSASHPSRSPVGSSRTTSTTTADINRPSLKLGLAEGVPDSIAPDHLGRADYLGTSVNLAARIMDAAAQAGQVVMSCELADIIFNVWRYEAEMREQSMQTSSSSAAANPSVSFIKPTAQLQRNISRAQIPPSNAWQLAERAVRVNAYHVGTYAFKGCGEVDAVCLTSDAMDGGVVPTALEPPRGSKGALIAAARGPVIGMQDRMVTVPNVLQEFQQAWSAVAAQVAFL